MSMEAVEEVNVDMPNMNWIRIKFDIIAFKIALCSNSLGKLLLLDIKWDMLPNWINFFFSYVHVLKFLFFLFLVAF